MKNKNIIIITIAALVTGLILGWIIFSSGGRESDVHEHKKTEVVKNGEDVIWTCSMHPQVKQNEPGQCPICGMDLIPMEKGTEEEDPAVLKMSESAVALANIQTTEVKTTKPEKTVYLTGKIEIDERNINNQITHVPGRIEDLYVNYTGQYVQKGRKLASIYSPELVSAQKELFEAMKLKDKAPGLYEAAREKLKLWKLTDQQIDQIAESGKVKTEIDVLADVSGYVLEKKVNKGSQVKLGETLFKIADLSRLWAMFDVYEEDLPWVHEGDLVEFEASGLPGKEFKAKITYMDPVINTKTRTVNARTEIIRNNQILKPEMILTGKINARLPFEKEAIIVPSSAVMWTGKRSVVYVKQAEYNVPAYKMKEVTLGENLGDAYIIKEGLEAGQEVVTNGTFNLDAAAQLQNKKSMMYPNAGEKETKENTQEDIPDLSSQVPDDFRKQFNEVVEAYLKLSSKLIDTDYDGAKKSAKIMKKRLSALDNDMLSGKARDYCMKYYSGINSNTEKIINAGNIDQQRKAFISLSDNMIEITKSISPGMDLFVQFCPMANDNKGAFWLATQKEILNPYYGDMMLHCGEIKEEITAK